MTIQATFLKDAPAKTAGNVLIGEAEMIEEAVSIEGVMKRGGSDHLAEERTESAGVARTAATS